MAAAVTAAQDQVSRIVAEIGTGDSHGEFILRMDRRQANPKTAVRCPEKVRGDAAGHGALGVTGDAAWLVCGNLKCNTRVGISRGEFEGIDREGRLPHEAGYDAPRRATPGADPANDVLDDVTAADALERESQRA